MTPSQREQVVCIVAGALLVIAFGLMVVFG